MRTAADVVDNSGGQELYEAYAPGGGVLVCVSLPAVGKVPAGSFVEGKGENVGFPHEPAEVAHDEKALRAAPPKLTDG